LAREVQVARQERPQIVCQRLGQRRKPAGSNVSPRQ